MPQNTVPQTPPDPDRVPKAVPVVLSVPADKTYVVLIRSTASHLGARLGFTVAEISDLRLAVDEACGLLLIPEGFELTGDELECRFTEADGELRFVVSALANQGAAPDTGGFGWSVLAALVDGLVWSYDHGRMHVELVKRHVSKEN